MDDLHAERLRVLKMLEEGKVSAEECAELLSALETPPLPPPPRKGMTPARIWATVGAALVLVGFWLPWVIISVYPASGTPPERAVIPQFDLRISAPNTTEFFLEGNSGFRQIIQILTGGKLSYGLGWAVLVFAIGAAMIPKWKPGVFLLIMGLALLGYLVTTSIGAPYSWGLGLIVVFLGYLVEITSLLNERLHVEGIVVD